jgi:hypothetical protein
MKLQSEQQQQQQQIFILMPEFPRSAAHLGRLNPD